MTCILTRTGQLVDLKNPRPESIVLADIALALSRLPRFGGHTARPWTVADHCLLVCDLMPPEASPELRLAALLHDAHEAYLGDITTPVAQVLMPAGRHELREIKHALDTVIAKAFGLHPEIFGHPAIGDADRLGLSIEAAALMDHAPAGLFPPVPPQPAPLPALATRDTLAAQNHYLLRALHLIGDRHRVALSPDALAHNHPTVAQTLAAAEPVAAPVAP